jgi:hypothetical protein
MMRGDIPGPIKRGACPGYDAIVVAHETRHLPEAVCDPTRGLHAARFADPTRSNALECQHRRESIAEMDAILPKAAGACKTGIQAIRDDRAAWVRANCP